MSDQQRLVNLHRQGLLNADLAKELNLSLATVKRWKKRLQLGVNCPDNLLGRQGERFVLAEAGRLSLPASHSGPHHHPYDLMIAGQRVDVKTASYSPAYSGWRFRLPRERSSFYSSARRTPKAYERDCDWLALVGLSRVERVPAFLHFVRPAATLTNVTLHPADFPGGFTANWGDTDLTTSLRPAA
ncbi:hypothetical protein [Deinococcus koreensis]|uniref:Uncharacterized protein n=1 Tax=Deinococcus koreensis TaxID=2054903 RepID=A0A2K3UYN9_9DEIO|nr:hypothetical protein [Deinococcus koreensis]PNY81657.1 hypothetical protein CVO96_09985 [Deinococcus koreensis]